MQIALLGVLGFGLLAVAWFVFRLNSRIKNALGGSKSDLESSLNDYFSRVKALEGKAQFNSEQIDRLNARLDLASQKISIVRYNPFGDSGGDQSFSLAVLDTNNSGYVLTSIHGREHTRTYIKPIDIGVSKHTLSKEEKQAIDQASKRVPKYKPKAGADDGTQE